MSCGHEEEKKGPAEAPSGQGPVSQMTSSHVEAEKKPLAASTAPSTSDILPALPQPSCVSEAHQRSTSRGIHKEASNSSRVSGSLATSFKGSASTSGVPLDGQSSLTTKGKAWYEDPPWLRRRHSVSTTSNGTKADGDGGGGGGVGTSSTGSKTADGVAFTKGKRSFARTTSIRSNSEMKAVRTRVGTSTDGVVGKPNGSN